MELDLAKIEALCPAPLAGDNPAGAEARYDPDYDAVKQEVDKLTAMAAGESGVDWEKMAGGCLKLLTDSTKDLNLAAYLALALFKLRSYPGLASGLAVVKGLMDNLWEDVYPAKKRMKGRANVFNWMEDRLGEVVEGTEAPPEEAEAVRRALALADKIAQEVSQKVDVPVTGLSGFRGALRKWVEALPAPAAPPAEEKPAGETQAAPAGEAAPSAPPAQAQAAAQASAPPPSPSAPLAAPQSLDEGLGQVKLLVNTMRGLDPGAVVVYLLARNVKWAPLASAPPAEAGGRTQVPGPRDDEVETLSIMLQAGNWKDLAEQAEALFLESPGTFLLDLQRMTAQALGNLNLDRAARAVEEEAGRLLNRLPELAGMSFADGRPFADPLTREWLEQARAKTAGGEGGAPASPQPWRTEALKLASGGDLAGALDKVQEAVTRAPGRREAMHRRLEAAVMCLDYGKPAWALPVLKNLAAVLEESGLADWDAGYAADVWAGLVRAYQGIIGGEEAETEQREGLNKALDKLFELDIARAARLSQPAAGE